MEKKERVAGRRESFKVQKRSQEYMYMIQNTKSEIMNMAIICLDFIKEIYRFKKYKEADEACYY